MSAPKEHPLQNGSVEAEDRLFLGFANYRGHVDTLTFTQTIATTGSTVMKYFLIDGSHFLAFGNKRHSNEYNKMSSIYIWSGTNFTVFQEIQTSGAGDVRFPEDELSNKFLVLANYFSISAFKINSLVYKWSNGKFVHFYQDLPTDGMKQDGPRDSCWRRKRKSHLQTSKTNNKHIMCSPFYTNGRTIVSRNFSQEQAKWKHLKLAKRSS